MTEKPLTPGDPRPNYKPYYIDSECEECGSRLVLYEDVRTTRIDPAWWDEWWCMECQDGIHMDWPDSMYEELDRRAEQESHEWVPLDEVDDYE